MSSPIDGGTILVTGASSGIGRDVARLCGPRAKALVLVARREDRLTELADELRAANPSLVTHVFACDLADRAATEGLARDVDERVGAIDVLINNAGLGDLGVFDRTRIDRVLFMMEVNCAAPLILTRAFLPGMISRGRGAVLMVSSGFGLAYLPGFAAYIATKHFVSGFTESLRVELAGTGVRVGQVCPGPVATEFEGNIGNFTGLKAPGFLEISAEACARTCVATIDGNRAMAIPHVLIWIVLWLSRATPRWMVRLVLWPTGRRMRRMQARAQPEQAL